MNRYFKRVVGAATLTSFVSSLLMPSLAWAQSAAEEQARSEIADAPVDDTLAESVVTPEAVEANASKPIERADIDYDALRTDRPQVLTIVEMRGNSVKFTGEERG